MPARTKPALLEREAELDQLQTALEDARRGTGRLVVVEGAAGIGKTRLLESARETAGRTGIRALAARGTEARSPPGRSFAGTRTPLSSWVAAIWQLVGQKQGMSALALQRLMGLGS